MKENSSEYATSATDVIGQRVVLLAGTTASSLCVPVSSEVINMLEGFALA